MPYGHISYVQFRQQLAARLSDSSNIFWTDAELKQWSLEALRCWGAHSNYWRERGTFVTAANTPFYDISSASAQMSSLLADTVTDQDLVQQIQYHLMEPPNATTWTGSEQFTYAEVATAIQRRRDQFLSETGAVMTRTVINVPPNPVGRVPLVDTVIDVRRCAWVDTGPPAATTPLFRSDEYQMNAGLTGWSINSDTPSMYSTIITPPLTVQLSPVPANKGSLDMLTVNTGAALNPAINPTVLGIPDDFAWVVKFGALADLMGKDGLARNPDQAAYCEQRWQQGCELARINPTVILAEINGVDSIVDSLWAVDTALPDWQTTAAQPTVVASAGRNIVALANVPDAVYSVTLDVVRNSVIPTKDTDFLQVGREVVDVLLDYAEHLAAFKMQGEEWKATNRAAVNMMRQASQYNEKLRASATFKEILWPTVQMYKERQPRRKPEEQEVAANG